MGYLTTKNPILHFILLKTIYSNNSSPVPKSHLLFSLSFKNEIFDDDSDDSKDHSGCPDDEGEEEGVHRQLLSGVVNVSEDRRFHR